MPRLLAAHPRSGPGTTGTGVTLFVSGMLVTAFALRPLARHGS